MGSDPAVGDDAAAGRVPMLSIVVPCYNSAWIIDDKLLSLRHQTLRDTEILIIDDGSTDDLGPVLAPHLAADPRIRVIRQENRGLAGARNRGLMEARAPYVGFIDADDLWHPRFAQTAVAALEADPAAPYAFAYFFRLDTANRVTAMPGWRKPPRHDFAGMLTLNAVGNGSAAIFRRDLAREVGGFDEGMRARGAWGAEDWKLCLRLAARGTPVLIPQPLIGYRWVEAGMSQGDPSRQMRAVRAVLSDIAAEFPQVTRRQIADGQVTMNGWLMGAFLRKRRFGTALALLFESYVRNPLWFTNPLLRELHRMKVANLLLGLTAAKKDPVTVDQLVLDGERPFAFIPDPGRRREPHLAAAPLPLAENRPCES